jgi:RNA recognition motif-containing protein
VGNALKTTNRANEKLREMIRFKASKRRCNLYVKNFPINYEKEEIVNLFK